MLQINMMAYNFMYCVPCLWQVSGMSVVPIVIALVVRLVRVLGRLLVPELGVLDQLDDGVQPEAVDADVEPEAEHLQHLINDSRIPVVQVRLLDEVLVEVELLPGLAPLPHGAAERRHPVGGWDGCSRVVKTLPAMRTEDGFIYDANTLGSSQT